MDVGDSLCNLECTQKAPPCREFIGPVKIILVEPPKNQYMHKTLIAALLSFANALLTINLILVFFVTVAFKRKFAGNFHIIMCTLGIQYFMFSGILMNNSLFGPAAPVKRQHRQYQHAALQVMALAAGSGGVYILNSKGQNKTNGTMADKKTASTNGTSANKTAPSFLYSTPHTISGMASLWIGLANIIIGPLFCFLSKSPGILEQIIGIIHKFVASAAVLASSVCFILGIIKPTFRALLPINEMYIFMITFCVIYTLTVIFSPLMKFKNVITC